MFDAIKGYIPVSMLDWEGRIVTTLFLAGCNFRCPFCQNPEFVDGDSKSLPSTDWAEIEEHLISKKNWLDGVCITGGEPTISPGLTALIKKIKSLDLAVKLDTNGNNPKVLSPLIDSSLVDCIAMDVKTSFSKYPYVVQAPVSIDNIKRSIELVLDSRLEHEFRTTVVPNYVEREDVLKIAQYLADCGAKKYRLQQFNPKVVLEPEAAVAPFDKDYLKALTDECNQHLPTKLRGT